MDMLILIYVLLFHLFTELVHSAAIIRLGSTHPGSTLFLHARYHSGAQSTLKNAHN